MGSENLVTTSQRLLNDREIVEAIEKKLIIIEDPDVYLGQRRDDLIQPASMDLVLRSSEDHQNILGFSPPGERRANLFERAIEGSVTFWPGYQTETSVEFLRGYDGSLLSALPELRSTLRRVGLDIGFNPFGIGLGDDEFGFLNIRNPQSYPVSIEIGQKIAQAIWIDRGTRKAEGGYGIEEREIKHGSGRLITSKSDLLRLIGQEDLYLSDLNSIGDHGEILFHAGKVRTYCKQGPVSIGQEGVKGFEIVTKNAVNHRIYPGHFSDIETIERVGLSGRVAMRVFYHAKSSFDAVDRGEMIDSMNTVQSSGGWVDPGYGYGKVRGAPFSVQRKAFSRTIVINEGDLVGYGLVFHFPEPVEKEYSRKRGSHYNEASGFVGPKK